MNDATDNHDRPPHAIDPIDRTPLVYFAAASDDMNPMHYDIDNARSAGFDDVFAQGMLSMAYMRRILTDNHPLESLRSFKVRFMAITPLYARPEVTARVLPEDVEGRNREGPSKSATIELRVTLEGVAVVDDCSAR